jgi:hypothetical protein
MIAHPENAAAVICDWFDETLRAPGERPRPATPNAAARA